MSRQVELDGFAAGRKAVLKKSVAIYEAKSIEDIGRIAGEALEELSAEETFIVSNTYCRAASWRNGFFEGFMERAQELKGH